MNYKNCKHYNEVVRVLVENLSLDDVNFEIGETEGCECKTDEHSVCELWVNFSFAHDLAPQLGIEHAEQTITNLDTRIKEIATVLVSSVASKPEIIEESEYLPEPKIDNQWYESLTPEQKNIIDELNELDNTSTTECKTSQQKLIVEAISKMDIDNLEILVQNNLADDKKEEFLENIQSEFKKFKENNDTHLIAHSGICGGSWCGNYGSRGYSFTGNNSNTFYNLVFEEENGICKCYKLNIDDSAINEAREDAERKDFDSYDFTQSELDDLPF